MSDKRSLIVISLIVLVGILLIVLSIKFGIAIDVYYNGLPKGYIWHPHMWLWHGLILPLVFWTSIDFYRGRRSIFRHLTQNNVLEIVRSNRVIENPVDIFEQNANRFGNLKAWTFVLAAAFVVIMYVRNDYFDYRNPTNFGYKQIAARHSQYTTKSGKQLVHYPSIAEQTIFNRIVLNWAIVSLILLSHLGVQLLFFIPEYTRFLDSASVLDKQEKGLSHYYLLGMIKGENEPLEYKINLQINDQDHYLGLGPIFRCLPIYEWLIFCMFALCGMHRSVRALGGHGSNLTENWITVGAFVPIAIMLIFASAAMHQAKQYRADLNIPMRQNIALRFGTSRLFAFIAFGYYAMTLIAPPTNVKEFLYPVVILLSSLASK